MHTLKLYPKVKWLKKGGGVTSKIYKGENGWYKILFGDTLSEIANHYGVTINQLKEWNPDIIKDVNKIKTNTSIRVAPPIKFKLHSDDEGVDINSKKEMEQIYKARHTPDYVKSNNTLYGRQYAPYTDDEDQIQYYTIQRGDTLWGLSKKLNIPLDVMLHMNNMDITTGSNLHPGDKIILPVPTEDAGAVGESQYMYFEDYDAQLPIYRKTYQDPEQELQILIFSLNDIIPNELTNELINAKTKNEQARALNKIISYCNKQYSGKGVSREHSIASTYNALRQNSNNLDDSGALNAKAINYILNMKHTVTQPVDIPYTHGVNLLFNTRFHNMPDTLKYNVIDLDDTLHYEAPVDSTGFTIFVPIYKSKTLIPDKMLLQMKDTNLSDSLYNALLDSVTH